MKICFKCNLEKDISCFYKHPATKDKTLNKCKECTKNDVKLHRGNNLERIQQYDRKRSKHSIPRILDHKYRGLVSRSTELQRGKKMGAYGKPYLNKNEWAEWLNSNNETFSILYKQWEESGFAQRLAPSVDRIDNSVGYTPENMRWITQSENSSKGNRKLKQTD